MKWVKEMKKALKKRSKALQKSMPEPKKSMVTTLLVGALFVGSVGYKKPAKADNGERVLGLGILGTAVGGAAGGGKGAAIGAGAGLGLGLLTSGGGSSRGHDPYRELNRLERKRDKAMNMAEKYRARAEGTSKMRSRDRYMRRVEKYEAEARGYDRRIARMKANLGMRG